MLKFQAVSAMVLAALTGLATASPGEYDRDDYYERRGPMPFEVMDRDHDGYLSADEHAQARSERQAARRAQGYPMRGARTAPDFDQIDRNGDGAIDRAELGAWQAQRPQQQMPGSGGR